MWPFKKKNNGEFTERQRAIYRYWDGAKQICADPVALYKRMMDKGPELSIDLKVAMSPMKGADKAHTSLCSKIRWIFNLSPLEGGVGCAGTLSDTEACELLDDFLVFCERVKKNSSTPATWPTETPEPGSADSPPTSSSSDSGSTEDESCTVASSLSPTE